MSEVNTRLRAAGFGLWAFLFAVFVSAILDRQRHEKWWILIPFCALALSMETFLLFKLAHYLPTTTARTIEWHDFFYESWEGSRVLLALSTVWFFIVGWTVELTFVELVFSGSFGGFLRLLAKLGNIGILIGGLILWFGSPCMIGMLPWVFWTGAKAWWRVVGGQSAIRLDSDQEANLGFMGRN
ncbi:hypothetical protein B0J13DRAFT_546132 [Dactylonectria estremocensis]|uniref:Uncharacterized protein n=1 Tax=Dactylonectria estremocensis TaxID=1079267 RepID=A0A9P9F869_9HYPO|nr:hypothetical protein B0J13DRAFT_546132 [Dactylonectria estremocensis]